MLPLKSDVFLHEPPPNELVGFTGLPIILPRVSVHAPFFREVCKDTLKKCSGGFSVVASGACLPVSVLILKPQHKSKKALQFFLSGLLCLRISFREIMLWKQLKS